MNMLSYRGYLGTVEYSPEDHCLFGKLAYIRSLVNYEAQTVAELEQAFEKAVDDYIVFCKEQALTPERPCKGSFNVRIGPELHRHALLAARGQNLNLNEFVKQSIEQALGESQA